MMVAGDGRVDRLLLDTNRDGVVDYDELSTFLRSRSGSEGVA